MYFVPIFLLMFLELQKSYITRFSDLHEGALQTVVSWVLTPCRMKWILMFRLGGGVAVLELKNWVILCSLWKQFLHFRRWRQHVTEQIRWQLTVPLHAKTRKLLYARSALNYWSKWIFSGSTICIEHSEVSFSIVFVENAKAL